MNLCRRTLWQVSFRSCLQPRKLSGLANPLKESHKEIPEDDNEGFPKRVFSGIQPTGSIHLGNYLGAVQRWTALQNAGENVTFCIVDLHSITLPQNPIKLQDSIFLLGATLFACGIDPNKSTVFIQSAVPEHAELCWILNCSTTMARLGHLPQFKEKSRKIKDIPLGLYVYPVLQAADIMLYKATHVPVGEDQLQHIQLAQHLTRNFNREYGKMFPVCHALIEKQDAARIRSLRDPNKKMSKSDTDPKATIHLTDGPDLIIEKFKKAVTDFTSEVTYEPNDRPGVSNLVAIHSLMTGIPIEQCVEEAKPLNTGLYKLRVAEAVIEHLKPIRLKINEYLRHPDEIIHTLDNGANKAREIAANTMMTVKQKVGLGTYKNLSLTSKELKEKAENA